jgi:hypothetical protein
MSHLFNCCSVFVSEGLGIGILHQDLLAFGLRWASIRLLTVQQLSNGVLTSFIFGALSSCYMHEIWSSRVFSSELCRVSGKQATIIHKPQTTPVFVVTTGP